MLEVTERADHQTTNDAEDMYTGQQPYAVEITITGIADLLFHRWSNEAVEAKSKAKKGSSEKKSDNVESYVYRADNGNIALPSEYVRMAVIGAAKYRQDPRSPRKSAMDLFKASIVSLTPMADLGKKTWDYEDKRRVVIQRSAITRTRPAMKAGWTATMIFQCLSPEYVAPSDFLETLTNAGRLVGVGDFRPSYGRFQVTKFDLL